MVDKVNGYNYTSNNSKLLKHLGKLQLLQDNIPIGPVMIHLSLTNNCNLNCSYCCYGGRIKGEVLSTSDAIKTIDSFCSLGTKGLEFTGGGDPLLHPYINSIVEYASLKGMKLGLITNGLAYDSFNQWDKLSWIRLSSHVFNDMNPKLVDKFDKAVKTAKSFKNLDVGSVHIYHGDNGALERVVAYMDENRVPTRITPDLTKDNSWINDNMLIAKDLVKDSKYCFISDFNFNTERKASSCWARLVKPFVAANGIVYECPGASFAPENYLTVGDKYKICTIDDILNTYMSTDNLKSRDYSCSMCKYDGQNVLIEDLLRETKHNDFA